jgi:hypothetical protein
VTRPQYLPRTDVPYFPHQLEQAPQIRELAAAAMFWQVGTGKTRTDIEDTMWQFCHDKIDTHIVIAPVNVHEVTWVRQQIPAWCTLPPTEYRALHYVAASNAAVAQAKALKALVDFPGLKILTLYFQVFASASGRDFVRWFAANCGRTKVTVDESHHIMSPGSHAATFLGNRTKKTPWPNVVFRRIMSATPTGDGPENLYSQYRFLDPDIIGASTYAEYKSMFVREVQIPNTHFKKKIGYHNIKYLNKRIAPYTFVAKKPPGLPPIHYYTVVTHLSDEQRKHYDEMRNEYQTQLRTGHWVEGEIAITRIKRLLQIAAGHLPVPAEDERKTRTIIPLECPRVDDCVVAVRGCPEKVIVWAEEQYEVERLLAAFATVGVGALAYYGGVSNGQRTKNQAQFEHDLGVKVLVANPQTGGEGFTVIGVAEPVSAQMFYSHNWSRIIRVQAEGRNHRPGTKAESCTYGDMVGCPMDTKVRRRVMEKDDLAQLVADPKAVAALLDEDYDLSVGVTGAQANKGLFDL